MYQINVLDKGFVILRNLAGPTRRTHNTLILPGEELSLASTTSRAFDADDIDPANAARMSFDAMDNDVVTLRDGSTRSRTVEDDRLALLRVLELVIFEIAGERAVLDLVRHRTDGNRRMRRRQICTRDQRLRVSRIATHCAEVVARGGLTPGACGGTR